ncbi:glutathione S-transferase family protein [Haloarchaeobius amylolyticus]|uniref:glutathione S-transferase family protein n=1 Tax=Haloarchaeobius amylolyticus TaxID=1198296 RepID=UPI002270DB9A|nr:glutathione S-transferase family protein [Haloarchaeobius amylolyticus]
MHMLVDGEWREGAYQTTNEDGEFDRQETSFRDCISNEEDARFQPEADRYHLYVSRACPWAHRAMVVRRLLGLEDVVSMDVVDPYRDTDGWQFTPEKDDCTTDSIMDADYLREVYTAADDSFTGRVTVPVLWDREEETIVNNESEEVIKMFADAMAGLGTTGVDLYPDALRDEIDAVIEDIYEPINNGVYRAGFADSQAAHERAVADLFGALDHWNEVLADQRYLVGERLTLADVCLFTTLVRFDEVYHTHFKCNVRHVTDYDHLWGHTRELFQLPGVAETVNMAHIKEHYYTTHGDVNPKKLVPVGPAPDFAGSHDRDSLAGGPPEGLLD